MKFKKEELSAAIKAKLTANNKKLSMSERTLNDMVSNHYSFADEETELADFVSKILPTYESLEGNYRKDNADFAKQWEKDHPTQTPPKDKKDVVEPDDATAKLLARIEALENERKAEKSKLTISEKRSAVKTKATEKGIKNSEWLDNYLATVAIAEDSDVDAMAENALKLFNISNADIVPGITPSAAGGGGQNDKDEYSDIAKKLKRE